MTKITWQHPQPPATLTRASKYDDLVRALKRRPGKWAVFSENTANSTAAAIRAGKIAAFRPAGNYEATSASIGGGRTKVWVRYVGRPATNTAQLHAIREWASANGWVVSTRGRVPQQIIDAYDTAHPDTEQ